MDVEGDILQECGLQDFLGCYLIEVKGDALLQFLHEEDRERVSRLKLKATGKKSSSFKVVARFRGPTGEFVRMRLHIAAMPGVGGAPPLYMGCLTPQAEDEAESPPAATGETHPDGDVIRAARALIGWSVHDLADRSGVSNATITRLEASSTTPRAQTRRRLIEELEAAGVVFGRGPGGGPCVGKKDPG